MLSTFIVVRDPKGSDWKTRKPLTHMSRCEWGGNQGDNREMVTRRNLVNKMKKTKVMLVDEEE